MLDHDLEGFVLGHVVLDARETRLLPVQRYLPPRMPVENGALARREERLSDRPRLLGHAAHAGRGDRTAQRLIGRMGPQRRRGSSRSSHAVVPSSLLESPRVDPGLGNIVATLLARRTCLFGDVPITIEPVALGDQILKTGLHGFPRRVRTET